LGLAGLAGCLALSAFAEGPTITNVVARQRWPWSRLVNIDYVLECADTQRVDVAVAGYSGTASVILPVGSLSGDLYNVSSGARRIVWDPGKTTYTNELFTRFSVELTPAPAPLYMIVDLTKDLSATNQVTYIYPGDGSLMTTGRWTNVWFGVTNDVYRKDKLVLRRVPAGSYMMGANAGTKPVTLTQACYAGVFEVTEAQWYKVMAGTPANPTKPKLGVTYNEIRGSTNNVPPIDYPAITPFISPTNFLGVLRAKTGIGTFNLPTSIEWEYLCRAGTTSYFNDGTSTSAADTTQLSEVGWWIGNCSAMPEVGGKAANCWGIYDTLGSVYEWCMTLVTRTTLNDARVVRGGSYISSAANNRVAYVANSLPDNSTTFYGFRLVMTLPK